MAKGNTLTFTNPEDRITQNIYNQVITVETANALNNWVNTTSSSYLETNFNLRLDRTTTERNFIRISKDREEMVIQELDATQTEDFLINDPKDSTKKLNVYFTSIEGEDAYRYFTLTNPIVLNKNLTNAQVESYKVKVKKVKSEKILYSKALKKVKMSDGTVKTTVIETHGENVESTGQIMRGKYEEYQDQKGRYFLQHNQNNSGFTGLRFNSISCQIEYWDMKSQIWKPLIMPYSLGTNASQIGSIVIHPKGATKDTITPLGAPALHVVHDGTVLKDWTSSKLMQHLSIIGEEVVIDIAPIIKLITVNITVTAFDNSSCQGLTVSIVGAKSYTGKTDAQGKCKIIVDDDNYVVSVTGYDEAKYASEPVNIAKGGVEVLNLAFTLSSNAIKRLLFDHFTGLDTTFWPNGNYRKIVDGTFFTSTKEYGTGEVGTFKGFPQTRIEGIVIKTGWRFRIPWSSGNITLYLGIGSDVLAIDINIYWNSPNKTFPLRVMPQHAYVDTRYMFDKIIDTNLNTGVDGFEFVTLEVRCVDLNLYATVTTSAGTFETGAYAHLKTNYMLSGSVNLSVENSYRAVDYIEITHNGVSK